jgi:hypothetical protein
MAGTDLRGEGGEADRQVLDRRSADRFLQPVRKPPAADKAGAANSDVEVPDNAPLGE